MLSDILTMIVTKQEINITKTKATYFIGVDVKELISKKRASGHMIIDNEPVMEVEITLSSDMLTAKAACIEFKQFFPHDMIRCIVKDLNKDRNFNLDYRKHLVYDYSKDHYSLVIPYEVTERTVEKAKEIVRRYSTGKINKPTAIVLDFKVIIVKGDNSYLYDL